MSAGGRTRRNGPASQGTVLAARAGDARALDLLVAESLPLVYNIVGRALDGHPDTDDVVQETLLRVVRGLGDLREPEAYRSWLVAIAVRQVRDRERERSSSRGHQAGLDTVAEVPDPASDFTALTVLRLGLTDQRREVAEATRWLDQGDRELLALWWLEETGEIDRAELAEALGLSGRHTAVRVQRMKEQIETARTIVRALRAEPGCPGLYELTRGWDGVPGPLWRKRLARHIRECSVCNGQSASLYPVGQLLGGLPLLPVPPTLAAWGVAGTHSTLPQIASLRRGHRAAPKGRALTRGRALLHGKALAVSAAATGVAAVAAGALVVSGLGGSPAAATRPIAADRSTAAASAPSAAPVPTTPSAKPSPSAASHSATASRSASPSRTPSASPAAPAVQAPVTPVSSSKKGVSAWSFSGVDSALTQSGASWYYTWSTTHSGISTPANVGFVPMIWGSGSVTSTALAQAKSAGPYLLGFNEPDMSAQSNMTVDQALQLWPQLEATGKILGSPAVAYGGDTAGGWLDRFMSGAKAKGYRVDFIALHWYGSDFTTTDAVSQLRGYLQAVYDRYHLPIWLTEYALINFSGGTSYPTGPQQAAFVTASTKMLSGLSYLQRYAWFALPASDTAPSTGLFRSGPVATDAGKAFESAGG
ncbi:MULTISPECIES: sigma-70 family RNA polymerase sigma factor [Streptacidiphilus]|uniref:Sigma-70 family RNA polymerase sigma factor n=1 Tax=Streptacidiphilus cavernicola TaxID=3342716 RepID=A0ABV6UJP0_9ACTN|nr:sigma-70 family RNA polymerase sigma factor [Streptacidiphilus jeojiense]